MSQSLRVAQNLISLSVRHIILNPIVAASLLWALTKGPPRVQAYLVSRFAFLRNPQNVARIVKFLKGALAVGVISTTDRHLNRIALNAWRVKSQRKRWDFKTEIAVVTGGCSGIGELIVKDLVQKNVRVAVLDIQKLPVSLQGDPKVHFFACDITDPAAVYSTADTIRKTIGSPSILINNAGIVRAHPILEMSDEWLRKIYAVNIISHFTTVKAFLPDMIKADKGHIVSVASVASFLGVGGIADYCSTKAAVLSFHESLNQELKHHYNAPNILTTLVHPLWVKTPLIKSFEQSIKGPLMDPQLVADDVVEQIIKAEGGQIFLPRRVQIASKYRGLSNWIQETIRAGPSKDVLGSLK